ncbi:MAG TPA: type II toxin-antitoxin system prevent-host-death family antitoxin [Thermoanaerobaculia bacterium]|jgi:antitoxin YefM|nr:type II toxin-antitoxin system prevent-host-death family antitoxin [Thermoanaerobaculia bacterium]
MRHTTYAKASANLEQLLDEVAEGGEPVIIGRGKGRNVAVISTRDLRSLLETIHVFKSPNNARRLLEALEQSKRGEGKPQTVEQLRAEFGLDDNQ